MLTVRNIRGIIGIIGIKKTLATGYLAFTGQSSKVKYFDNIEEAKDYLAE